MTGLSSCSICSAFERMQLPVIGNLMLILGSLIAVISLVAWPLLFVWPLMAFIGFGMAMGHGACTECRIG